MIKPPALPKIGVCALVPEHWNSPWQPRHQVLSRLAQYFQVVWVSPAPEWRTIFKRSTMGLCRSPYRVAPAGFVAYRPKFWPPKFYRPKWLSDFAFDLRVRRACYLLRSHGCERLILYVWRPEFARALMSSGFDFTCYHIDDEYSFSAVAVDTSPVEKKLIKEVNQVFIHSPGLIERLGSINPNTAFIPNGVDYEEYSKPNDEPFDLAVIPRPRIGYTGWIKKHLDWGLLRDLVIKHRQWSFVFVGPIGPHPEIFPIIEELSTRHNVYFLGAKSVPELAAYPQHFDICVMPYALEDYSAHFIYPLKLHEYLASGTPVVGTPIRTLKEFSNIIRLGSTADEWSAAISSSLEAERESPTQRSIRRAVAKEHDWNQLVGKIAYSMARGLGCEIPRKVV